MNVTAQVRRSPPRVVAIASHPIQYQAPLYRALAANSTIDFSVLFIQQPDSREQGRGFDVAFEWDIPLLEGYPWQTAQELRGPGGLAGFFAARLPHPVALLRRLDPDVLLITGWQVWPLVQMLMAARWAGVPVIMRGESNALRRRPWAVRAWHRMLLGACAVFLPIGRASREFYQGYGIDEGRLFDTPYFVDNARFGAATVAALPMREQLRAKWSIPERAICFCYAGKLEPKKRILDLLEALRIAVARNPRIHLLVVGSGELLPQAHALVAAHQLPVSFTGFLNQTEIPSAYVASDCLVLPSDHGETWGLVVNEAMACGRPAIVSDRVGCAPDLVVNGETGVVFPFGDMAALADRLVDLAANPDRLQTMGELARERVLSGYSIEKSVEGTLQAVRYVLDKA